MAIAQAAALLLAAGLSRRYGPVSKLVADYRGKPLALHAAETLAALPFGQRIAVCRLGDDELALQLRQRGFRVVVNPDPGRGLSSSIITGVEAAGDPEALLICLADMPLISAAHIGELLAQSRADNAVASVPAAGGPPGPPAIFGRRLLPQLLQLEGDRGARDLLRAATTIAAPPGSLADFDTPADFRS